MKKTITFYPADKPPKESGEYLCYIDGEWIVLMYSVKHNLFNAYDAWPYKDAKKNCIHITYWAKLPKMEGA
jgi:hypothetical protein